MKQLFVREKMEVRIYHQPAHAVINKNILSPIDDIKRKAISSIGEWIVGLMESRHGCKYNLSGCWISDYNKGEEAKTHSHIPYSYSFVYFVRCPKGSSPLVLTTSGRRIKAEEGNLIIKPGYVWHHVPKNGCDGRITLAGNLLPQLDYQGKVNSNLITSTITEVSI